MMDAFAATKGTDPVKVARAIAGPVDALCGSQARYRDVDHQLIWPMWFGDVRADGTPHDPKDIFNVIDEQPGDRIERSDAEMQGICKMAYP
jgi:hypothetical protein